MAKNRTGRPSPAYTIKINLAGALRILLVALAVIAQLALLLLLTRYLRTHAGWLYLLLQITAVLGVLALVDRNRSAASTTSWLLIILLLPVFGFLLFLLWGRSPVNSRKSRQMRAGIEDGARFFIPNLVCADKLKSSYPQQAKLCAYLENEGFPVYQNTACKYYPLGEEQFAELLIDLRQAEQFIFLEFFIIAEGKLWQSIQEVLLEKAAAGVEIRLLYDDCGSIFVLPPHFRASLEAAGIQVLAFNKVHRYTSRLMINYRNHQKIVVIDGKIGYTGGTNLADEYANIYPKFGHWKDTAIRLEGEAVWSLTITFLQMWQAECRQSEDYGLYQAAAATYPTGQEGFFQPFSDGPVNHPENPAEAVYRQMAFFAQKYLYIMTPYLVIDEAMSDALCLAAQSGVDVRILTPKIWDKWYIHMVTRSNYGQLLAAGVRIFEYEPGFIHAKTVLCDDCHAVTGSINLDYRSLYLHFENGVWICGAPVIQAIRADFEQTLGQCEEISLAAWQAEPFGTRLLQFFLRLFVPLM